MAQNIFEAVAATDGRWQPERFRPSKMPRPTSVRPGPEKVAVFRARLEAGEDLWHPDDAYVRGENEPGRVGRLWRCAEPGLPVTTDVALRESRRIVFDEEGWRGCIRDDCDL